MSLKETIESDILEAMRKGEKLTCSVLRMLKAVIINQEKEKRARSFKQEKKLSEQELIGKSTLSNEEIVEVICTEAKKRKESILEYEKVNKKEVADKEKEELAILQKYLPEQLSEKEIKDMILDTIKEVGACEPKDMGKVMSVLVPKIKGRADGGLASRIVRESLSSSGTND